MMARNREATGSASTLEPVGRWSARGTARTRVPGRSDTRSTLELRSGGRPG